MKLFSCLLALIVLTQQSPADPQLTSWFSGNPGQYARIYQSAAAETAGNVSKT